MSLLDKIPFHPNTVVQMRLYLRWVKWNIMPLEFVI